MQPISITILGGDLRQCYLADYMYSMGHTVTYYGTMPFSYKNSVLQAGSLADAVSGAKLILCPMPFSKDGRNLSSNGETSPVAFQELLGQIRPGQILFGGNIPDGFLASCGEKGVSAMDLMKDPSLALANAALTAEGLLSSLIAETPFSLSDRKLLLLGYGRCGQEIAKLLKHFNMQISAYDNDMSRLAKALSLGYTTLMPSEFLPGKTSSGGNFPSCLDFDLVINTIPLQVLTPLQIKQLPDTCILFDIASAPGGFDGNVIKGLNLKLICCPGIPGKAMPQTAGELIGKTILERML